MTTRRDFLKTGALATAGILVAPSLMAKPKKISVIVIGAGLSGLAAADKLRQKGYHYTVLESQNRFGGRVFSQPMDDLVVEFGGEWVGTSHYRIRDLCDEFKLDLQNNQMDTHLIYKNEYFPAGKWQYSADWQTRFEKILADYANFSEDDKKKLDRYDWWRYLVNNGCQGRDLDIRELADSTDFGESIRHVSAYAALSEYAESSEKNEMDCKIAGGNGMLAKKLAERIGLNNILLQHKVERIVQEPGGVKVYCDNGKRFEADKVICTLPTFAIRKIAWQPELPPEKMAAIEELQYARINKHAMLFEKRFWKDESFDLITDQLPHYFYHATKNQKPQQGVLISYSVGDKAAVVANQTDRWNAQEVVRTLEPHFGAIGSLLRRQQNVYWGNNDYSFGAYALYKPGQWFGIRPALQQDFLHTSFAGEHLADWQGFMEGAIVTGESAAEKL